MTDHSKANAERKAKPLAFRAVVMTGLLLVGVMPARGQSGIGSTSVHSANSHQVDAHQSYRSWRPAGSSNQATASLTKQADRAKAMSTIFADSSSQPSTSIQPLSFQPTEALYSPSPKQPTTQSLLLDDASPYSWKETEPTTLPKVETILASQTGTIELPIQKTGFLQQHNSTCPNVARCWTILPNDLLFRSYIGAPRESRMASQIMESSRYGTIWELEAGGRVGILRYGTPDGTKPAGWQLDVEGAAFPRLNFDESLELDAVDFRVGVPLTWAEGPYQFEFEIYHLSSHVGDEYLLRPTNAGFNRLDYLRDAATIAFGYFPNPDLRLYAELEYAFNTNDGAEPFHIQFGFDYMPVQPTNSLKPVPFFAVNGQLREEVNFGGGINVVGGVAWRGHRSGRIFRAGFQYYNGESFQLSFFDEHEQLIGAGIWYDF